MRAVRRPPSFFLLPCCVAQDAGKALTRRAPKVLESDGDDWGDAGAAQHQISARGARGLKVALILADPNPADAVLAVVGSMLSALDVTLTPARPAPRRPGTRAPSRRRRPPPRSSCEQTTTSFPLSADPALAPLVETLAAAPELHTPLPTL
ncbi:hypothetical protein B0H17DRAFT_1193188 [Mycena rosella]|uniref:Uncharacterized protein n=1 Tax=Mycena rosella TaxID=1033263 RepID=A0AAD7GUM2_MYCRO|nr:hypothetical protein B0H17DRAFT_1193188 [Mycena rosella]